MVELPNSHQLSCFGASDGRREEKEREREREREGEGETEREERKEGESGLFLTKNLRAQCFS